MTRRGSRLTSLASLAPQSQPRSSPLTTGAWRSGRLNGQRDDGKQPVVAVSPDEEAAALAESSPDDLAAAEEKQIDSGKPERALQKERKWHLRNESNEQNMRERIRYANNAYGITQAWVGFLIVLTIMEFSLKPFGYGLGQTEFVTVFTTTTASIFGFWLLVGRYLFPATKEKD
jgi:hypothetical protein